jgi:general secretion pathway protein L
MPGKILGLDINEDFISAVQVVSGLKGFQVISHSSVMVDKDNNLDSALKELSQNIDMKSDTCIASISGDGVLYQNLIMPFKEPKKIKQTLPFEMETLVPFSIDDLVIDFNIVKSLDHSEVLAVAAKKALISEYLERLKTFGISPHLLDIRPVPIALWLLSQRETSDDGIMLDIGLNRISIVLFIEKRIALVRYTSLDGGFQSPPYAKNTSAEKMDALTREEVESILQSLPMTVENSIRSFAWQTRRKIEPGKIYLTGIGSLFKETDDIISQSLGLPVEQINISEDKRVRMDYNIASGWNPALMDGALSLAVREIKKGHGFNLRKGEFEIKKSYLGTVKELRKAAMFLLVILIFLVFDFSADYYSLKKRYAAAEQRCAELFSRTFPDTENVKYPVLQMRQKIDELKKSSALLPGDINKEQKVLGLINDISQRIPKTFDVDVTNMVIDTETIRISGETDTFNTVNSLKSELESSVYFNDITINSAKLDRTGKRVDFEIKLRRKK